MFSNAFSVSDQVSHPHNATGKITVLYILILRISIEFIFEKVSNPPCESQIFLPSLVFHIYKCQH